MTSILVKDPLLENSPGLLTHSHSELHWKASSATLTLLKITWGKSISLENIWRGVVVWLLINISPSNIFPKKILVEKISNLSGLVWLLLVWIGYRLTLMLLVANLANTKWCKKPKYSARAIQWIPIWQGLDDFQKSVHSCALDESSLSIWRVKISRHAGQNSWLCYDWCY